MSDNHLQQRALELLLENFRSASYEVKEEIRSRSWNRRRYLHHVARKHSSSFTTVEYSWPAICSSHSCGFVQESTATLLYARALVKANRTDDAWKSLRSLFAVQGYNGFLPKYRYFNSTGSIGESYRDPLLALPYFYEDTSIPTLRMFGFGSMPSHYQPCPIDQADSWSTCHDSSSEYTYVNELGIKGSARLSALPMHSTIILEMFYLSNQTVYDIKQLGFYFGRLYKLHVYWMEHVMRCPEPNGPCYNIIHPWESLTDMSSPEWSDILGGISDLIKERDWTPNEGMHPQNYNIDEEVYNSVMYLTECQANVTSMNMTAAGLGDYEQRLIKLCPFAMLDIGHLAVLSRSNHDLLQIGNILHDFHSREAPTKTQSAMLRKWISTADKLMENHLWDDGVQRYMSRNLHFVKNSSGSCDSGECPTTFDFSESSFVTSSASANLMACWNIMADSSRFINTIVSPILQHDDNYSYNCGPYPISSSACDASGSGSGSGKMMDNETIRIEPLMNYLISVGLIRNEATGAGNYIQSSTVKLMCSNRDDNGTCTDLSSANVYTYPSTPLNLAPCDRTSTISRAILFNILTPEKPFSYVPPPPMRNSWVIVLIVAEIMIAFGVGLSCFLLSFNLMRRLKKDAEEENLLRLAREQNARAESESAEHYEPLLGSDEIEGGVTTEHGDTNPASLWRFISRINPFQDRGNLQSGVEEET